MRSKELELAGILLSVFVQNPFAQALLADLQMATAIAYRAAVKSVSTQAIKDLTKITENNLIRMSSLRSEMELTVGCRSRLKAYERTLTKLAS